MRISLVVPKCGPSMYGLEEAQCITGRPAGFAPLGAATVAALTPSECEVTIFDENVKEINFDEVLSADVVGISVIHSQFQRAEELSFQLKSRGARLAWGGPFVTRYREMVPSCVDHTFVGEAENTWPRFIEELRIGCEQSVYLQRELVDVRRSPVPRFDLLEINQYCATAVQTTRGCPFNCEFCDTWKVDGRKIRTKTAEQVVVELESAYQAGARLITFADDNFIGSPPSAKTLLKQVAQWNRGHGYRARFSCEASLNLVEDPVLMNLMREANLTTVFVGVESPDTKCLEETRKNQNTGKYSVDERVILLAENGFMVMAGIIVGFDADDKGCFRRVADWVNDLGIPYTTAGQLVAMAGTDLADRLGKENRLLGSPGDSMVSKDHASANFTGTINFQPKLMSPKELEEGAQWMTRRIYSSSSIRKRLRKMMSQVEAKMSWSRLKATIFSFFSWRVFFLTMWCYATGRPALRKVFWTAVVMLFKYPTKIQPLVAFLIINWHAYHLALKQFGDPEDALEEPFM